MLTGSYERHSIVKNRKANGNKGWSKQTCYAFASLKERLDSPGIPRMRSDHGGVFRRAKLLMEALIS